MKKLLYLPLLYEGQSNEQGFLEYAFKSHFFVRTFDFMNVSQPTEELLRIVEEFKPDIIHCQFQGTSLIDPGVFPKIRKLLPKVVITQWTGDVRTKPIQEVVDYGKEVDLTLVCSTTDIKEYEKAGVRKALYWQNAVDPSQLGFPNPIVTGSVFCGGRYTIFPNSAERIELVLRFAKEFSDFEVYGHGWDSPQRILPWHDQPKVYQKKFFTLGHNNVPGKRWWFSDRQLISMASGRPHVCQYSEDLEELFEDGVECLMYRSIDEAVEKAKWLYEHPVEAQAIGEAGKQKIRKEYLWSTRVEEYLKILEDL